VIFSCSLSFCLWILIVIYLFSIIYTPTLSQKVLDKYNEIFKDTTYSLDIHVQRVDEKIKPVLI
jgi:hypothetical protein